MTDPALDPQTDWDNRFTQAIADFRTSAKSGRDALARVEDAKAEVIRVETELATARGSVDVTTQAMEPAKQAAIAAIDAVVSLLNERRTVYTG